jgi:AcrR family transcriptional regulator
MSTTSGSPGKTSGTSGGTRASRRSRRDEATLVAAILDAAIAEVDRVGYANLNLEGVAELARASKASLYRRWPGKFELVMDAIYHVFPDPSTVEDTGSLRTDLLAALRSGADQLAGPAGHAIRGVIGDVLRDPRRAAQFRAHTRGNSAQAMREIVQRAARRGELDPATITSRQLEAGLSLMRFHFLTNAGPVPDEVLVEIVDEIALPLFAPPATTGPQGERTLR